MRRIGILAGAVLTVALIVFACSGGDDGDDKGGAGGAGGSGGVDAAPAIQCTIPKCVTDLQDMCRPAGTCTFQGTKNCFSNGVKSSTVLDLSSGGYVVTYTKPDGKPCYSTDVLAVGSSWSVTIKNAAGATVATAMTNDQSETTVTCMGAAPVQLTAGCGATGGLLKGGGAPDCNEGVCD